jgi:hypothetical protein
MQKMSPLIVLPKGVPGGASVKPQRAPSMFHNILQLVFFTIFINGLRRGLYCSTSRIPEVSLIKAWTVGSLRAQLHA